VLDLVESVIGPDIALFSSHFICKPAGDGKSVPWHQDAHFWRDRIDPAEHAITVWLAIDPSTRGDGRMRVIPGSHLGGGARHQDVHPDRLRQGRRPGGQRVRRPERAGRPLFGLDEGERPSPVQRRWW
jgi:hypothetical protein